LNGIREGSGWRCANSVRTGIVRMCNERLDGYFEQLMHVLLRYSLAGITSDENRLLHDDFEERPYKIAVKIVNAVG